MTNPSPNSQQNSSPAPQLTELTLLEALMQHADMPFDRRAITYLEPFRAQVRAAALRGDGESLSAYATRGVLGMLRNAGFEGHLMPGTLIKLIDAKGWDQIHDAIAGNRNAMALLTSAIAEMQPMSAAQPPQRTAQPPQRHDDDRRPAPSDQRREPASEPRHREQAPPPSRGHHPLDGPDPSRQGSGVRRHDQSNVRSIQSHPNHPGNDEGAGQGAATEEERRKGQKKVYGGRAALTLEVDNRRNGAPTIRLEAAKILNAEARTYDWKNKIVIQLTTSELQKITALLLGMIKQAKFSNHGPKNDKWFEFSHQEEAKYAGTVKVAVGEGREMCIVSITHEDIGDVTSLFLRQTAAAGGLDQAAVPAILRPVAQAYNLAVSNRGGGGQRQHG